jgi:hypothetical protein
VPCTAQHQTFGGRCLSCGFVNQTGEAVRGLHKDWGGYGILAPDLTQD